MKSLIRIDRKQVFGVEELDDRYMKQIKGIYEERIKNMTLKDKSVTMPLSLYTSF